MLTWLAALCCLAAVSHAAPDSHGFVSIGAASGSTEIRLALQQRNLGLLEEALMDVSVPGSPRYGRHWTLQQVKELVQPAATHQLAVSTFLDTHAKSWRWSPCNDYAYAVMDAAVVEKQFGVKLLRLRHKLARHEMPTLVRSLTPYTIPDALADAVRAVDHVTLEPPVDTPVSIQRALAKARSGRTDADPGETITPPVIHSTYSVPNSFAHAADGSQALAEFEQAYFYPKDLVAFQAKYGFANNPIAKIVGKNDPNTGYLGEASLDVEYITTVAPEVPTWVFSLDQFDLVAWGNEITATTGAPLVHSVSWGSAESGYDARTLNSANAEFQKMGLMGFTIVVASGDDGTDHSGLFSCGKFQPGFPASSPYVLAVGGTYLTSGTETGWQHSGGGFSDTFGRPSYQEDVVKGYLAKSGLPSTQYFNSTGRAIPDVSALSTNFNILINGAYGPLSGTSAATPTFAGQLAFINGARKAAGKSPLGLVAPALYANPDAFTDITAGNNVSPPCPKGFPATTGYDAITGLGTPNFPKLLAALSS